MTPTSKTLSIIAFCVWGCAGAQAGQGQGAIVVRIVDDATGSPVPARVYVFDSDGRSHLPKPRTGETIVRYDRKNEATREVYASVGAHAFQIVAPPGLLQITVERGKEYVPLTREVRVTEGLTHEETFRLHRLFNMAQEGWYSGEMHVHSGVDRLPAMQLAEDLNVAFPINAWTYSDTEIPEAKGGEPMPGRGEVVAVDPTHVYWSLNTEYELDSSQYKVPLGGFLVLGHTAPLKITIPPFKLLIEEARRQHAFFEWDMHTWPWSFVVVPVVGIDTVPLSNCHMWRLKPRYLDWGVKAPAWMHDEATAASWADYTFQSYYALLNCGFKVQPSAGTANGVHPVPLGYSRVYVHLNGPFSYEKWKEGLLAGRSFVTNGPMLLLNMEGLHPGDRRSLASGSSERVDVNLEARSVGDLDRIELIVNGKMIPVTAQHAQAGNTTHLRRFRVPIDIKGSSWVAARCFETPVFDPPIPKSPATRPADNIRFAHTAPIFFDDPSRPLLPEPRQIHWLTERVGSQIDKLKGKVPDDILMEYRQALKAYQAVADRVRAAPAASMP